MTISSSKFIEQNPNSLNVQIINRLSAKISVEIQKLNDQISDSEYVALATRNIYELELMLRYIGEGKENTIRWMLARIKDEREVINGIIKYTEKVGEDVDYTALNNQLNLLSKHESTIIEESNSDGLNLVKAKSIPNIKDLAIRYNDVDRYNALYKLTSKLVHQSPYLIWNSKERIHSEDQRGALLIFCLESLLKCLNIFKKNEPGTQIAN